MAVLLGSPTLGDVLVDAGHPLRAAGPVDDGLTTDVDPSRPAVGSLHAVFRLERATGCEGLHEEEPSRSAVLGEDRCDVRLKGAVEVDRSQRMNAVHAVGPLHQVLSVPEPRAGVGQHLALAQTFLALGERRGSQLLLADVSHQF